MGEGAQRPLVVLQVAGRHGRGGDGRGGRRFRQVVAMGLGAGHGPVLQQEDQAGGDQHHHGRDQADAGHARVEGRNRSAAGLAVGVGHCARNEGSPVASCLD
jgi:hypothetical protein